MLLGAPPQAPAVSPAITSTKAPLSPEKAMEESLNKQRASLEKQRQAIHTQLLRQQPRETEASGVVSTVSFRSPSAFIEPLSVATPIDCPALDTDQVSGLITVAAQRQSLDPALLRAVMRQESAFRPCAISDKGALGLMQLMPATARELHVVDVLNPEQNVQAGAAYLKRMLERYNGDLRLALVGYNAGPGRADQPAGKPFPLETQNYVAGIFNALGLDQGDSPSPDSDIVKEEQDKNDLPANADNLAAEAGASENPPGL
jgi:soluble lytic murein transglycosylase-like protein